MNNTRPFRLALYAILATLPTLAAGVNSPDASLTWQGPARLERCPPRLPRKVRGTTGTLAISDKGVDFRPRKGSSLHWTFVEIRTVDLEPRRVVLSGYERRGWLRPGTHQFRFDLQADLPPNIATELVRRVGRPARNGDPGLEAAGNTAIPAFHRTFFGGSNGVLQIRKEGIAYVTKHKDRRFWRWSEIQTLSNLDPYHLVVFGFRDMYSFELKQPLPRDLYERISDEVDSHSAYDPRLGLRVGP
jgi:hypothetical protein